MGMAASAWIMGTTLGVMAEGPPTQGVKATACNTTGLAERRPGHGAGASMGLGKLVENAAGTVRKTCGCCHC